MFVVRRSWGIGAAVVLYGGLVACVGGAGAIVGTPEAWESPARSTERAPNRAEKAPTFLERATRSTEAPGSSSEPAPFAQGSFGAGASAGSFDCSGTYVCRQSGDRDTDSITLSGSAGACSVGDIDIQPDGKLTYKGRTVGSWVLTSTGFAVTTTEGTTVCTRGAPAPEQTGGASSAPPPDAGS
jgi:hypothetical protein